MPDDIDDEFEWDEAKNHRNLIRRKIDFEEAVGIWEGDVLDPRSDRDGEERWLSFGIVDGRVLAVVWTPRDGRRRIISARVARRGRERKDYQAFARGEAEGPD